MSACVEARWAAHFHVPPLEAAGVGGDSLEGVIPLLVPPQVVEGGKLGRAVGALQLAVLPIFGKLAKSRLLVPSEIDLAGKAAAAVGALEQHGWRKEQETTL